MGYQMRHETAGASGGQEDGFTIIEMLIACLVLLVGVLSVASMIGSSVTSNVFAKNDSVAAGLAERELERLKSLTFSSLADGTTNLTPVALANNDREGFQATYTLSVTIVTQGAVAPAPGVKRITVTARRQNFNLFANTPPVQLTCIKAP